MSDYPQEEELDRWADAIMSKLELRWNQSVTLLEAKLPDIVNECLDKRSERFRAVDGETHARHHIFLAENQKWIDAAVKNAESQSKRNDAWTNLLIDLRNNLIKDGIKAIIIGLIILIFVGSKEYISGFVHRIMAK